jgi:hypothetical protein
MAAGCDGHTTNAEHWRQQRQHIHIIYVPPHSACAWIAMLAMFRHVVIRLKVRPN